jgi:hypothetical protein
MSAMIHKEGPPLGTLHQVRATFGDPDAMQQAVDRLETSGFDRADLSLPEAIPPVDRATPEAGAKPVNTEPDARQARTLYVSAVASAAALTAAGVFVALGSSIVGWPSLQWLAAPLPGSSCTCSAVPRPRANRPNGSVRRRQGR